MIVNRWTIESVSSPSIILGSKGLEDATVLGRAQILRGKVDISRFNQQIEEPEWYQLKPKKLPTQAPVTATVSTPTSLTTSTPTASSTIISTPAAASPAQLTDSATDKAKTVVRGDIQCMTKLRDYSNTMHSMTDFTCCGKEPRNPPSGQDYFNIETRVSKSICEREGGCRSTYATYISSKGS